MELIKVTDRVWYSMYEKERDRPCLGYVKGDRWNLAIDAGHSEDHVADFYEALQKEGLPLPDVTIITHWHWDHSFGMHKVHGLTAANERTNRYLLDFADQVRMGGPEVFLSLDPCIRREYADGKPVVIVPADIVFAGRAVFDLGGITVELSMCISPHTDDSTLVRIPEEKILFVGDCISGEFPTWVRDPDKTRKLIDTLREIEAERIIGGHWPVFEKNRLIEELEEEILPGGSI